MLKQQNKQRSQDMGVYFAPAVALYGPHANIEIGGKGLELFYRSLMRWVFISQTPDKEKRP